MSNLHIVSGYLGADPELKYPGASGKAVVNLRLATSEHWTSANGQPQERTDWHDIVVWGPMAENLSKYKRKGDFLEVQGRVHKRFYEHATFRNADGTAFKVWVTEIVADRIDYGPPTVKAAARKAAEAEEASAAAPAPTIIAPAVGINVTPEELLAGLRNLLGGTAAPRPVAAAQAKVRHTPDSPEARPVGRAAPGRRQNTEEELGTADMPL